MSGRVELPINHEPPPGTFMTHWVIYKHPKDQPDRYVLRPHHITDAHNVIIDPTGWAHRDVEVLRSIIPPGMVKLDRHPDDDPVIYEVWL